MTNSEYVLISPSKNFFGEKNLLQSQLGLLNAVESFQKYKELRNEELVLKVTLKNKIEETLNWIDKLEKSLPAAHYKEAATPKEKKQERKLSLEGEIARIREKLEKLGKGD